jgi:hypothetical protein
MATSCLDLEGVEQPLMVEQPLWANKTFALDNPVQGVSILKASSSRWVTKRAHADCRLIRGLDLEGAEQPLRGIARNPRPTSHEPGLDLEGAEQPLRDAAASV